MIANAFKTDNENAEPIKIAIIFFMISFFPIVVNIKNKKTPQTYVRGVYVLMIAPKTGFSNLFRAVNFLEFGK